MNGANQRQLHTALAMALVALGVTHPDHAQAGGWTQPEGSYYVKLWDRSLISLGDGMAFDADGETISDLEPFQDHQLNIYAEYGLMDNVTLIGFTTPIGAAKVGSESAAYVGATAVGGRVRLWDGPVKLATQLQYSYAPPIGDDSVLTQNPGGGDPLVFYVPTVETHAGELQLQAGYGLSWGWLTGSAGFRANSEDAVGHAITGFAQLGVSRVTNWTFDVHFNLYQSLDDVEVVNLSGAGRTSYLGFGLGAGYAITSSVAIVGSAEGVAHAQSNAATPSFALGIELTPES